MTACPGCSHTPWTGSARVLAGLRVIGPLPGTRVPRDQLGEAPPGLASVDGTPRGGGGRTGGPCPGGDALAEARGHRPFGAFLSRRRGRWDRGRGRRDRGGTP